MLNFFATTAFAQEAAPAAAVTLGSTIKSMAPLLMVMVIFYFLLIRPQSKRAKEHREMLKNLTKGAQVVTAGGIMGEVAKVDNDKGLILVQIAENVKIKIRQEAISEIIAAKTATTNAA